MTGARKALGMQLAELRGAAGYTQTDLAPAVAYSRSQVANVEAGHHSASREFWSKCDEVLSTGGELCAAYDEIEALRRAGHRHAATAAQRQRHAHIQDWKQDHSIPASAENVVAPGQTDVDCDEAIREAFASITEHSADADDAHHDDLESRVLDAYQQQRTSSTGPLSLVLVGGFAGSGKTEFARFLSSVTGWTILDKDTLTRALVERLLLSYGADVNDRQTDLYLEYVRPFEYRCLMDAATENLRCSVSTVVTAPFLREFSDDAWLARLRNRCTARRARFSTVWMKCDVESMYDYIAFRGAARDSWKLNNWQAYLATIEPAFEPPFQHHSVDNRLNAAVALADQARDIAARMQA